VNLSKISYTNADVNSKYSKATENTVRDFHSQSSMTPVRKPTTMQQDGWFDTLYVVKLQGPMTCEMQCSKSLPFISS